MVSRNPLSALHYHANNVHRSEEFGRKPILQLSLFLVNIWQLPVALAPNFASIMVGRALGGLSSAGGSVTLGMIADMWDSEHQQYAVAYVVFSSVGGSILGPVVGGFSEAYLSWRWSIWIQLIFGGAVQLAHLLIVPETRTTKMMDKIAKKRRKANPGMNIWGPNELSPISERLSAKEIIVTWVRPFRMFATEPIVLVLSLLSGFSDALVFMFIQSFSLVYGDRYNFNTVEQGLAFCSIGVGYIIAWILFIPAIQRNKKDRALHPEDEKSQYESRLWWLLWTAPCLPIGLIGFAWTSGGPPVHVSLLPRQRPTIALTSVVVDRLYDIRRNYWYCQLQHLHGHHRLHDLCLRTVLRLCYWR